MARPKGVILANIGTPAEPTVASVRKYLRKFLSDPRVVDYPRWLWCPLLELILLTRTAKTAARYKAIWTPESSPLRAASQRLKEKLQVKLGGEFLVETALSYTDEDVAKAFSKLRGAGCQSIAVVPLFPQYSRTTTESIFDATRKATRTAEEKKALRQLDAYGQDARYRSVLAGNIQAQIAELPHPPDFYLLSFHGIPVRYERQGDPYRQQCEATAKALAEALGWGKENWQISYQSRFGPEEWLEPATDKTLLQLSVRGVRHLAVLAPGFATDCIETLDELAHEGRQLWIKGGGSPENFHYLTCLNDNEAWVDLLAQWVTEADNV